MCPLSTMSIAGGLTALGTAMGGTAAAGTAAAGTAAAGAAAAGSAAAGTGIMASVGSGLTSLAGSQVGVGLTTAAVNAGIGAAAGAGISAATGGDAGRAALMGAATGGLVSGATMGLTGISTLSYSANGMNMFSNSGGLIGNPSTIVELSGKTKTAGMLAEGAVGAKMAEQSGSGDSALSSSGSADASVGLSNADKAKLIEAAGGALGQTVQSGVSGYGQIEQAKLNRKALDDQAKFEKIRAQQALDRAALEKMDNARRNRQLVGKAKVAAAANGIMLESRAESLASMWEQDQNAELAYDNAKIDYNAQLEAWGYRENARRLRQQGRLGVRTAKRGAVAGTLASAGIGLGNVALSGFTIGVKNGWFAGGGSPVRANPSANGFDWDVPAYQKRTANMNLA